MKKRQHIPRHDQFVRFQKKYISSVCSKVLRNVHPKTITHTKTHWKKTTTTTTKYKTVGTTTLTFKKTTYRTVTIPKTTKKTWSTIQTTLEKTLDPETRTITVPGEDVTVTTPTTTTVIRTATHTPSPAEIPCAGHLMYLMMANEAARITEQGFLYTATAQACKDACIEQSRCVFASWELLNVMNDGRRVCRIWSRLGLCGQAVGAVISDHNPYDVPNKQLCDVEGPCNGGYTFTTL